MLSESVGGSCGRSTHCRRPIFPLLPRGWRLSTSVTAPPLTSDSKSVHSGRSSVSGNTTHSHGPSIFGAASGERRIVRAKRVLYSRVTPLGAKGRNLVVDRSLAMLSWLTPQSGIRPICCCLQDSFRVNPVNPARGIYPICRCAEDADAFKLVKPAKG